MFLQTPLLAIFSLLATPTYNEDETSICNCNYFTTSMLMKLSLLLESIKIIIVASFILPLTLTVLGN